MLLKIAIIFSFIIGVFTLGYLTEGLGILIFVLLLILPFVLKKRACIFFSIAFLLGGCLQLGYQKIMSDKVQDFLSENREQITGVICEDVTRYDTSTYFYINLDNGIKAQVKLKNSRMLYPGYIVTLKSPKMTAVNIKNQISVANRKLLGRNAFLLIEGEELSTDGFNKLYYLQFAGKILREKSANLMKKHFYSKEASICSAMLSGENASMETDFYDALIASGTIHIIVVSGSHFAMLYIIIFVFLSFFVKGRRAKLFIILPVLIFFVIYTGSTITVLRSFIMASIALFADLFYIRKANSRVTLLIIASIFMAITPTLIYSPSFLLSFGAVLGMDLFYSDIKEKIPIKWNRLRDFTALFLSAMIFTAPIIYYFFARISSVSFIANLMLEPVIALILAMTIVFIIAASISYTFGSIIAYVLKWALKYFIFVVEWTAKFDLLKNLGRPYTIMTAMLIIGAFMSLFFLINTKVKNTKKVAAVLTAMLFIFSAVSVFMPQNSRYYVTFLGSEKTNSAVVTLKDNSCIFYGSVADLYYYKAEITQGTKIPLMIITEADDEVMLKELLDIYKVENIVASEKFKSTLHWPENIKFMEEKSYKATIDDLNINIISDGSIFRETIFSYKNSSVSFVNYSDFEQVSNRTIILHPRLNFEKNSDNFDKTIVLLSKKYYNNGDVKKYNNFSILELTEK